MGSEDPELLAVCLPTPPVCPHLISPFPGSSPVVGSQRLGPGWISSWRLQLAQNQLCPEPPSRDTVSRRQGKNGGGRVRAPVRGSSKACNLHVGLSAQCLRRSPQPLLPHHSRTLQLAWGTSPSLGASHHSHVTTHVQAHMSVTDGSTLPTGVLPQYPDLSPGQEAGSRHPHPVPGLSPGPSTVGPGL